MFRKHQGTTILEWIVAAIIVILIVGGALVAISVTLNTRFQEMNVELGG